MVRVAMRPSANFWHWPSPIGEDEARHDRPIFFNH
jgi:hypothetical protein